VDTRDKILTAAGAVEAARSARAKGRRVSVVTGYFDPLLAGHARRLAGIAEPGGVLLALVMEPERPILPARARAELVAALAVVDYVAPAEAASQIVADRIFREEEADLRRAQELIFRIRQRGA
jgi:bifunctional ADP-heptose synthase (sugar kinase/adenylyltransferase)